IPSRIDEAERSKPEPIDEDSIKNRIAELQTQYDALEQAIVDKNAANEIENKRIQNVQQQIHSLRLEIQNIEAGHRSAYNSELNQANSGVNEDKAKLSNLESQLRIQENQLKQLESSHADQISRIERDKHDINDRLESLRTLFASVNGRTLNPEDKVCKECGREHEEDNINELQAKFDTIKRKELESINEQGKGLKSDLNKREDDIKHALDQFELTKSALLTSISNLKISIREVTHRIENSANNKVEVVSFEDRIRLDDRIAVNNFKITELETQLESTPVDYGDLRIRKATINAELDSEKRKLNNSDQIAKIDLRIQELKGQEKSLSQELASLEKQEFIAEKYEKAKSEELENRVNGMFKFAKFKLFKPLINGGEEPTCQTTYNGVPFSDLNTAGKILVGIDIINTLSAHYGVVAPVFLDNRESVSAIPDTAAQTINLIVSPQDEKLRVA